MARRICNLLCTHHVYYMVLEDKIVGEFSLDYLSGKMFATHFETSSNGIVS